jgi:sirohydrochlorin cobaltochelatase
MTGLLLVGHGTRSTVGIKQFLALADCLSQRLAQIPVEPAFLELAQPDIDTAVARLVEHQIHRLVTMPLLLFAAGHAKQDIPRAVQTALTLHGAGHIEQVQAGHLGCHPALVELSILRMNDMVSPRSTLDLGPRTADCLLLVGRGSHDNAATAEMQDFARLRAKYLSGTKVEVAFLAMARPLLSDQLAAIGDQGYRQVFVQPHLLFDGDLADSISRQVAEAAKKHPHTKWLLAPPLADPPGSVTSATKLIEKAVLDRCLDAGIHVVGPAADD